MSTLPDWHGTYSGSELENRWLCAYYGADDLSFSLQVQEFLADLGDEPACVLEDLLPHFTHAECEQIADLWGIPEWCRTWRAAK